MTKYVSYLWFFVVGVVKHFTNGVYTYSGRKYKCVPMYVPRNKDIQNIEYKHKEADSRNYTSVEKGSDKFIMPHAIIMQLINKTDTQDLICFSNNMKGFFSAGKENKRENQFMKRVLFDARINHVQSIKNPKP